MSRQTKKTCGTCRYGKFERTPTGRAKADYAGRCLHVCANREHMDALLAHLKSLVPIAVRIERPAAGTIWPEDTDCNFWEERDEQPT